MTGLPFDLQVRHPAVRWLLAAALLGSATVLMFGYLRLTEGTNQFTLLYPAFIVTALLCGRGPSYAALLGGALIAATFWMPPVGNPLALDAAARWSLLVFLLASALMIETALAVRRKGRDLERQRAELQTMLEVIPAGVGVALDPRGDHITLSPRFAAMLGIPPDENVSKSGPRGAEVPFRVFRDGRELDPDELPVQRACRTGREVRDFEADLVFADGRRLELMISAAPLFDEAGTVRGAIAAHIDISALRSAHRALDQASRQKDEFLATLAHELRNPMAPIRYAAALLRPDAPAASITQARNVIERQAQHMGRLLDDLLDVSRITRNVIELRLQPLDLREIARRAMDAVRNEIEQHGHQLAAYLHEEPVWVSGDPDRLYQVTLNLLTNAVKYTERGGRISLRVDVAEGRALLRVEDTGLGLTPQMMGRMFDLFAQVHPIAAGGLGIGLSVVRRLVEMHRGTVAVSSAGLGQGSQFTLALPRIDAPAQDAPAVCPVSAFEGSTPRVLIVDDNRDGADALAAYLRAHGVPAHTAYGGREGTQAAESLRPDIMLLDIGMPAMDGFQVAQQIRATPWGGAVKLVAITGWGQVQDRRRVREAGFDDHLVKPADPAQVLACLRSFFREAA